MKYINAYLAGWKKIFTYSGNAKAEEYWVTVVIDGVIGALALVFSFLYAEFDASVLFYITCFFTVVFAVSMVPFLSLTVRRLHETGKSGWWSCLLFVIGIGTLIVIFLCVGSSSGGFNPGNNYVECVYGPPEMFEIENVEGENSFSPGENINDEVYGPPEMFEEDINDNQEDNQEGTQEVKQEDSQEDFDVTLNSNPLVYGPPEMFEEENVDGGKNFSPVENINEEVYGPPEMFGVEMDK